jgi:hypothetical protein
MSWTTSQEIVALLNPLLIQIPNELEEEFTVWEAASDKDWLSMERMLASMGE